MSLYSVFLNNLSETWFYNFATLDFQTTCPSGANGWGRKRRDVRDIIVSGGMRQRRDADDKTPFDDISVGTTLRVVADKVVIEGKFSFQFTFWSYSDQIHVYYVFKMRNNKSY